MVLKPVGESAFLQSLPLSLNSASNLTSSAIASATLIRTPDLVYVAPLSLARNATTPSWGGSWTLSSASDDSFPKQASLLTSVMGAGLGAGSLSTPLAQANLARPVGPLPLQNLVLAPVPNGTRPSPLPLTSPLVDAMNRALATSVRPATVGGATWTTSANMLQGYGCPPITGTLDNSGQVVADGRGTDRTLDLSQVRAIRNSTENDPTGGTNGWYAENHGSLAMRTAPAAAVPAQVWGEDPADPTLDLVNSVRVSAVQGAIQPLELTLLSPDRADVPPLAGDHVMLGVWNSDQPLTDVSLAIRYDSVAAAALGKNEADLHLWAYNGQWLPIEGPDLSIDTSTHVISGDASQLTYFAVSTPEPGSLLMIGAAMLMLARRRR